MARAALILAFFFMGLPTTHGSSKEACPSGKCEAGNTGGLGLLQSRSASARDLKKIQVEDTDAEEVQKVSLQRTRPNIKLDSSETVFKSKGSMQAWKTVFKSKGSMQAWKTVFKSKGSMQAGVPALRDGQCEEKIAEIGYGNCYDNNEYAQSLGWSKCTCGTDKPGFGWCVATGDCGSTPDVCAAECLENPECGGFMFTNLHCWMFKKMLMPTVKYNDPYSWYKCYAKDECCPGKCCPPFKSCAAWGDPHYTNTFFGGAKLMDFMGLGLYRLATTLDNSFELQAFQCPYTKGVAIFAAFALKVGGSKISIIGGNVTIDGQKWTTSSGSHSSGFKVETLYAPDDRTTLESADNCMHFSSINFAHSPAPNGYFHNLQLYLADSVASPYGVCGSSVDKMPLPASQSLFSADDNSYLCKLCGMTDCATMTPPADWKPISGPDEACANAGISMAKAQDKCSAVTGDYLTACIFDYCASAGSEDMVASAVESKQVEETQAKALQPLEEKTVNMCVQPYVGCAAWGDPHWTKSFIWQQFDFHRLGVFPIAKSTDGKFELQAFQCPWGKSVGSVFGGFAMKVGGSRITIIDRNISINGRLFKGYTHTIGLTVESSWKDRDTVILHTTDSCVHLKVKSHFDRPQSPGWGHDFFLDVAHSVISYTGVCGSWTPPAHLTRDNTLFSYSELDALCSACGMTDCVYMTPPASFIEVPERMATPNATDACQQAGISIDVATAACKKAMPNEEYLYSPPGQAAYLMDCVFDYCVSGGDQEMVQSAQEAEKEVIRMDTAGGVY